MAKAPDRPGMQTGGGGGEGEIMKSGWLSKRGDRNKAMKRRWCIVKDGMLEYYETQQTNVCLGSIALKSSLVEKSDKENAHLQCFFFITPPVKLNETKNNPKEDRTYVFCAETANEVTEWLNVFEDQEANVIRSVKEGVMNKSDAKGKNWTRRYFVLFEDRLLYYADPKDRQPKGSVPLLHAGIIVEEAYGEKNFMFEIKGTTDSEDGVGRTFTLSCFNEDDRRDWIRAIQRLITAKTAPKQPNCTREGWLYLVAHKGASWLHRYFVLMNGKLLYYRHKMDEIEEGSIDLSLGARFEVRTSQTKGGGGGSSSSGSGGSGNEEKQVVLPGARGLITAVGGSLSQQASSLITASLALAKSDIFRPDIVVSLAETYDANARIYLISTSKKEELDAWIQSLSNTITTLSASLSSSSASFKNAYTGSLLEGYLNKCNTAMNSWNFRYFVLFEEKLLYFKNKGDHLLSPAGEILLPSGFEMCIEPDVSNPDFEQIKNLNLNFLFSVCSSGDEGERRMLIQAKDNNERTLWMNALTNLWKKKLHRVNALSLREGYATTTRTGLGGKAKRFLILLHDKLCLFKKRMDDVPEREIPLVAGTIIERENSNNSSSNNNSSSSSNSSNNNNLIARDHNGVEINFSERRIVCTEYADDSGRKTMIEFQSKEIREDWFSTINNLGFTTAKIKPNSLKEGYAKKQGGKRKGWKLRYLVLTEKALTYYVKLKDTESAGVIELTDMTKITIDTPQQAGGDEHCVSIDNGGARIYRLQFSDTPNLQGWYTSINNVLGMLKSGKLFGGLLDDHCKVSPFLVPKICYDVIENLKQTALNLEGIFRVPGNNELIQTGVGLFEEEYRNATEGKMSNEHTLSPIQNYTDPHSVAGILKLYYRKLRVPLIPFEMYPKFAALDDFRVEKQQRLQGLSILIQELPLNNRILLAYQLDLLRLVSNNSAENKMNAKNCAMVFAPGLLRKPEEQQASDPQLLVKELEVSQNVLTLLLEGFSQVFPHGCPDVRAAKPTSQAAKNVMGGLGLKPRGAASTSPPPSTHSLASPKSLPPEWQEHRNQDGIPFYYNTITQQSVWVRPVIEETPPPPPPVEDELPPNFEAKPGLGGPSKPLRPVVPVFKDDIPPALKSTPAKETSSSPPMPVFGTDMPVLKSVAKEAPPPVFHATDSRVSRPTVSTAPPPPFPAADVRASRPTVAGREAPPPVETVQNGPSEKELALVNEAARTKAASEAAWAEVAFLVPSNDLTWQELSQSVEQQKLVVARAQEQLTALQARLDHRTKEVNASHDIATANAEKLAKIASAAANAANPSSFSSSHHHKQPSHSGESDHVRLPAMSVSSERPSLPPISAAPVKLKPAVKPPKAIPAASSEPDPGPCSECGCTNWKINPFKKGSCQSCFHKH